MKLEIKSRPHFTKEIEDRTVTGIFAVHGNVDDGYDRSWPGSFADPKVRGRDRAVFLWQHDASAPPVATINYVREVAKAELPEAVLAYAPDATGGVEVSRTYLETPRGDEVLKGVQAGAIKEMSYAYDVKAFDFEEDEKTGRTVRNLRKVELYDVSDVNWGMNPATAGVKALKLLAGMLESDMPFDEHAEMAESAIRAFVERAAVKNDVRTKEGRVLSEANRNRIKRLVDSLGEVRGDLEDLLLATEPKADPAVVMQLMIEYQRTLAKLNGATL